MITTDGLIDITGRKFVEFLIVAEDDDGDVDGAEDPELVGLLEETVLALYIWTKGEDDRPTSC